MGEKKEALQTEQDTGLFKEIMVSCLEKAQMLLNRNDIPTETIINSVKELISVAVTIDTLNLHWASQTRSFSAVLPNRFSSRTKEENSIETHVVQE